MSHAIRITDGFGIDRAGSGWRVFDKATNTIVGTPRSSRREARAHRDGLRAEYFRRAADSIAPKPWAQAVDPEEDLPATPALVRADGWLRIEGRDSWMSEDRPLIISRQRDGRYRLWRNIRGDHVAYCDSIHQAKALAE